MSVEVCKGSETLIVTGDLDLASADGFVECASSLTGHPQELALDLTGVEYMDSAGFRAILRLSNELGVHALVLRHPQEDVLQFLDIVAADSVNGIRVERS